MGYDLLTENSQFADNHRSKQKDHIQDKLGHVVYLYTYLCHHIE